MERVWRHKIKWYRRIDWRNVTIVCMALAVYAFVWYAVRYACSAY